MSGGEYLAELRQVRDHAAEAWERERAEMLIMEARMLAVLREPGQRLRARQRWAAIATFALVSVAFTLAGLK